MGKKDIEQGFLVLDYDNYTSFIKNENTKQIVITNKDLPDDVIVIHVSPATLNQIGKVYDSPSKRIH